jgi:hypothetical protein
VTGIRRSGSPGVRSSTLPSTIDGSPRRHRNLGVLIYWFLDEQLQDQDTWRFISLGVAAVGMAIVAPKGISGLIQKWRPLQFFAVRRHLVEGSQGD